MDVSKALEKAIQRRGVNTWRPSLENRVLWFPDVLEQITHNARGAIIDVVEAVGIEQPAVHPIQTIPERFRGQVSMRTRSKNTSKTRYRTFL